MFWLELLLVEFVARCCWPVQVLKFVLSDSWYLLNKNLIFEKNVGIIYYSVLNWYLAERTESFFTLSTQSLSILIDA